MTDKDPSSRRKDQDRPPIPTGWMQRGARLAGQTGKATFRFVGTRARSFAAPERAGEFVEGFHNKTAQQLVEMLGEMKGAAMKLGQLASFYEFSAPSDYLGTYKDALTMLQNSAPPMDPEVSRRVIEESFDRPVDEVFDDFEDVAIASASIGQVHRAWLKTGEPVAVKVQYPGVDAAIRSDLRNVTAMTKLAVAIAPNLDPSEVSREIRERVLEELDYAREARNQARFGSIFKDHPYIVIPEVYPDFCRTHVITQEYVEGEPFLNAFDWEPEAKDRLGEVLFRFFYGGFNRFGIFSADPHPGNYKLLPNGRVAFLDFGLVREVETPIVRQMIEIVLSLIAHDKERARRALEALNVLKRTTPEIGDLWAHLQMINMPVLEDRPFQFDAPLVQKIAAAGFDPRSQAFQTLRKLGVPGVFITFNRMSFGLASLFGRLEAMANWQAMGREMWFGEPSLTEIGKEEQDWLARVHPEHVPILDQQELDR
jgi:predicted unusual protein kinase regulating ubiquinone biosynthesis (AarF/ABC1/UbiB family)